METCLPWYVVHCDALLAVAAEGGQIVFRCHLRSDKRELAPALRPNLKLPNRQTIIIIIYLQPQ